MSNTTTPKWVVLKFGGTSVSTQLRWGNIVAIAQQWRSRGKKVLVVVSALFGVTDRLRAIVDERADMATCMAIANDIRQRHHALLTELGLPQCDGVDGWLARLDLLLTDPKGAECTPSWQANILALGEMMSSTIGAAYLNAQNIETRWLDAREHLLAPRLPNQSSWGSYLSASANVAPDAVFASNLASLGDTFITQGFVARNDDNETVLLGRGGSDTSAGYFGAMLRAEKVEIWTDVAGIFSANPRQVPDARLLKRLDYEEAQEIAGTGANMPHPRCIAPLRDAHVPLAIRDTNHPDLAGTEIADAIVDAAPTVKAICSRRGITLIAMESSGMWQQVGFLADVFERFKRNGLSVDLVSTSQTSVTVSLDPTANLVDTDALSALSADLAKVCRLRVIPHCLAITFVGRGMRSMLPNLSDVIAEFRSLRVHMISQSSNNLNLTFVVEQDVAADLVLRLHGLLIDTNAMHVEETRIFGSSWSKLYSTSGSRSAPPWWRPRRAELLELAHGRAPRYVYDMATLRSRAKTLRGIAAVDRWFYAIRTNTHPALLREIVAQGLGLECASLGELGRLYAALGDIRPDVLFAPRLAPRAVYASAFRLGARVTLDSLHPLSHWGHLFDGRDLILSLDLGADRSSLDTIKIDDTCSNSGLELHKLDEFQRLATARGVRIAGLRVTLGSGILDISHWKDAYMRIASIAERIEGVQILHISGGLGVSVRRGQPPLDLAALSEALAEVKTAHPHFELWVDADRYLVADAGVMLARVAHIERNGDVRYVGVDIGKTSVIPRPLYETYHEMFNLTRLEVPARNLVQIVGPICESGEVLGSNRRLPLTQVGDVLLIAEVGAQGDGIGSHCTLRESADDTVCFGCTE